MSKKFIPVLIILILGGLFVGFGVMGRSDKRNDDPKAKYQKILRNVGIVLEQGHYNPKKIDDKFSQEVLKKFEDDLDPDKYIFLQGDIDAFKKYENRIDDEIHGAPLESFYAITDVYLKRIDEVSDSYKEILKKPFDFNRDESLQTDGDKRNYPTSIAERNEYGRKRLKYLVLVRYVDLQEERDANIKKDSAYKPDSTLQREAIGIVSKQMDRYFETLKKHNTSDELFSTFVNDITGAMDPHTTYFAPVDKRSFDEMLSGTFYGIGAQLQEKDGKITIASLITGMPAWKSNQITPGDEIIKVAQGAAAAPVDVTGYAVEDAVKLIRGEKRGSEVRLTLKKADGTVKVVSILRDKISLDDTFARSAVINNNGHKIGYIYLPEFYANFDDPSARRSATDVAKEVVKLKAAHVEGIVIDLRGNGGGSLTDVVDMVGLFIKGGPVVQVKGRDGAPSVLDDKDKDVLYTGPLAVMVDELSASASEIFAAAIQDYHRGIIIGSSTYGKGTVQRNVSLDPQSENPFFTQPDEGLGDVKLTFRKFYRINGGATQLRGVVPDIMLPDRLENAKLREKDNPDALHWDEIPKANYTLWNPGYSYSSVVAAVNAQINNNVDFEGIKNEVSLLDKYRNEESPLNILQYKKMQKDIKEASKKLDDYSKLPTNLDVKTLPVDSLDMAGDTTKITHEAQFIKSVSTDIYISETVKVMEKVIGEQQVAERR